MSKRWILRFASAIVILNLLDAMFTLIYTSSHVASESNPFMQGVLAASPVVFMTTKIALVSLSVYLLWRHGHRVSAMIGLVGATAMYIVLIGYHLSAVPLLMSQL